MSNTERLKKIDKWLGTPLCYLVGIIAFPFRILKKKRNIDPHNILLIKTVALGDLVVALPTFKAFRELYPNAKVTLLTTPRVREVVEGAPYLNEIIYYDVLGKDKGVSGIISLWRRLRQAKYDLVVDLEHYYRFTTLLAFFSGAAKIVGFDLPRQGRQLLLTTKVPYPKDKHEVEAFIALPRALGAKVNDVSLIPLAVTDEDKNLIDQFWLENNLNQDQVIIGVHPGTSDVAVSRRWLSDRFAAIADMLIKERGAKIIFTGSADDLQLIKEIKDNMATVPLIAAGKLNLKQFAELVRRLDIFLSVDTGPLHIAAAMGAKVVGLYGPNTPQKWGPYGTENLAIYKKVDCSPCTKQYLGQVSRCVDNICMKSIEVDDVREAMNQMLDSRQLVG